MSSAAAVPEMCKYKLRDYSCGHSWPVEGELCDEYKERRKWKMTEKYVCQHTEIVECQDRYISRPNDICGMCRSKLELPNPSFESYWRNGSRSRRRNRIKHEDISRPEW